MGVKNLCLYKKSAWLACKLSFIVDGGRTGIIVRVLRMMYVMHEEIAKWS